MPQQCTLRGEHALALTASGAWSAYLTINTASPVVTDSFPSTVYAVEFSSSMLAEATSTALLAVPAQKAVRTCALPPTLLAVMASSPVRANLSSATISALAAYSSVFADLTPFTVHTPSFHSHMGAQCGSSTLLAETLFAGATSSPMLAGHRTTLTTFDPGVNVYVKSILHVFMTVKNATRRLLDRSLKGRQTYLYLMHSRNENKPVMSARADASSSTVQRKKASHHQKC